MKNRETRRKEVQSLVFLKLINAKTEQDLEEAAELADEAVMAGLMTQEEVDALWDDIEPGLHEYQRCTTCGHEESKSRARILHGGICPACLAKWPRKTK